MAIDSGTVLFEADFTGRAFSYSAKAGDRAKLFSLLSAARRAIAENIYDYAPIDRKAIDAYFAGKKKPKNPAELAAILSSVSMSSVERDLEKAVVQPYFCGYRIICRYPMNYPFNLSSIQWRPVACLWIIGAM